MTFEELIQSEKPLLIDFFAEWCGPCKMMSPVLKDVAGRVKGQARIIKIDIDKNEELASQLQIKSVPTLAIYKDGELKWRQSGMQTANDLERIIQENMN